MQRLASTALLICLTGLAFPAWAQRAEENAIADAEDAFGSNDGGEDLGLYGPFDVRGFSPIDAGNVRVEGLFMDRQADLSPRLIEGNRIRVGLTAVGYGLPAPSGIVDYRLRTPDGQAGLSAVVQANSFGGHLIELDARTPLVPNRLAVGGGVSASRSEYASGNNADVFNAALIGLWRPSPETEVRPFWSAAKIRDEDIYPIVQGLGEGPPQRIARRRFIGQSWADLETERFNYGLVGRTRLAGMSVRGGVFRSVNDVIEGHSVFLRAAAPGELAGRSVSAYPGRWSASTSGELGVGRAFSIAGLEQRLSVVMRGRAQDRRYGGIARVNLAPAPFGEAAPAGRPAFTFPDQSRDRVRQWSAGVTWAARRPGRGEISLGVQKVGYDKTVDAPGGPRPGTRDDPWLFNAAGVLQVNSWASLYASYATGLEESEVAPESAINRDEAPPAISTRQLDAGVRLKLDDLIMIAGVFDIERPYFGTDATGFFIGLGDVRHRGVEVSIAGSPLDGLTVVAGGVLLDARVSGQEVASRRVGERPVGTSSRKLIASIDWRPPGSAVSFDLAVEHLGPAWADTRNRARVGSASTVDVGTRFRLRALGRPAVLRLQATNFLNSYSWDIVGENSFVYTQPRQIIARLTLDF